MIANPAPHTDDLAQRLSDAEATIEALLAGQIDAVVDSRSQTPVLLARAQDALRDSEERYRRLLDTAYEGITIIDAESTLVLTTDSDYFKYLKKLSPSGTQP